MSKTENRIIQIIEDNPGIKATNIITDVVFEFKGLCDELPIDCIDRLVKEKKIVEVAYVLPKLHYKIKSVYFPYGTEIIR